MEHLTVRQAAETDLAQIFEIWLAGAQAAGLSIDPRGSFADSPEQFFLAKLRGQTSIFQIWVAENERGKIMGWQSLSECRNNPISRAVMAESSTYIRAEAGACGLGRRLLLHAMDHAAKCGLQSIVGYVSPVNGAIIHLVTTLGWEKCGRIPKAIPLNAEDELWFYIYSVPNSGESAN